MITSSKSSESMGLQNPTAILEFSLDKNKNVEDDKVVKFELKKEELDEILEEFEKIQKVVDKARGGGDATES